MKSKTLTIEIVRLSPISAPDNVNSVLTKQGTVLKVKIRPKLIWSDSEGNYQTHIGNLQIIHEKK